MYVSRGQRVGGEMNVSQSGIISKHLSVMRAARLDTDWKGTHRFLDQNLPQSTATPSASFHAVKTRRAILSPFTIDSQDVEAGSPRQSPEHFPVQQPLCDNKGQKEKRRSGDVNGHKPPLLAVEWRGRQDGDGAGSNGRSTLKHRARCPRRWLGC